MNYIYDIYLNFNEYLYDFFDWNKNDKLVHVKMIPIFKITEENLKKIINNNIQIEKKYFHSILNKAKLWNKSNKYKSFVLFCDNNNVIAVEFDENGKSVKKSFLNISEELEILENFIKTKTTEIKFSILSKCEKFLKTRKQIEEENFIKDELLNIDSKKLEYVFFECFGKYEKNKDLIKRKLLNISKNSKTYKNLYNILKLTSTTNQ